ncbi:MAG: DUF4340 domain-containing protein [Clostridia bacterium]|nr:DUF4340 domain-containing protein [Clostridia bacterium]
MTKRTRNAILGGAVLLVLVAALVVLLLLPEAPPADDSESPATEAMDPLVDKSVEVADGETAPEVVQSVTIAREGETFTIKPNADGVYAVEAYADLPVYESAVEILFDELETITPESKLETPLTDPTPFGFGDKGIQVSVTYTDGDTYAFELGDKVATGSGYYYREKDANTIYVAGTMLAETVDEPSTYYVGRSLTTEPQKREDDETGTAQLMKVEVTGVEREPLTIRYKREGDRASLTDLCNYLIEVPVVTSTNLEVMSDWQTKFNNLSAMEVLVAHPTAAQKAQYGLDAPKITAYLTLGVHTTTENEEGDVTATEVYNARTYTLYAGDTNADGDYYMMVDGLDIVFLVGSTDAAFMGATFDDVVLETPLDSRIQDVERVVITANGKTHTFVLTHVAGKEDEEIELLVNADGDPKSDPDNFRAFYSLIVSMERHKGVTDAEADAFMAGNPAMSAEITLERLDGDDEQVQFYEYDGNRTLIVRKDGRRYLVKTANVETILRQMENVLAGKTVVEVY